MKIKTRTKHGPLVKLHPFFKYFGSKWRNARTYPPPKYPLIREPFAGSAGYSVRWHNRDVVLNDISSNIAGLWRYLSTSNFEDIMRLPLLRLNQKISSLDISRGAKLLLGFNTHFSSMVVPGDCIGPAAWALRFKLRMDPWGSGKRQRVARQVKYISHWQVEQEDYKLMDTPEATWFIDPPYQVVGSYSKSYDYDSPINYKELADWCRGLKGQVIVCEQEGATWLPFKYHRTAQSGPTPKGASTSREVIYTQG